MNTNPYILSNGLTSGIASWFKDNSYFYDAFKSVFNYCRIDIPTQELDAVSIYLMPNNDRQKPNKVIGKVKIAVSFNLRDQREEKALHIYQVLDMIRVQLLTNPTYLQSYLSKEWTPGLQWIQSQNDIDYSAIENSLLRREGAVMIPIILDYQIDILLNQRAIWYAGNDYFSPVEEVYHTIEHIDSEITTEPYNS